MEINLVFIETLIRYCLIGIVAVIVIAASVGFIWMFYDALQCARASKRGGKKC